MKYKLIALDLDGTLYNSKKEITPKTVEALKKAQDLGVHVILSSGRSHSGIMDAAKAINLPNYTGYISAFNGGKVVDVKTGEILLEKHIKHNDVEEIYKLSKTHKTNILVYIDEEIYSEFRDEYIDLEQKINRVKYNEVPNLLEVINKDVPKFILLESGDYLDTVEPAVQEQLKGRFSVSRSEPFFLEVMPFGIDKGTSLVMLCEKLGVDISEVIACGDSYNDLPMVKCAGLGVAMGNARDAVKEVAKFVTLSNDEDGIAHVLEKFVFSAE